MIRGFKVKLHPTNEQKILMLKSFGTARFIYNWALNKIALTDIYMLNRIRPL